MLGDFLHARWRRADASPLSPSARVTLLATATHVFFSQPASGVEPPAARVDPKPQWLVLLTAHEKLPPALLDVILAVLKLGNPESAAAVVDIVRGFVCVCVCGVFSFSFCLPLTPTPTSQLERHTVSATNRMHLLAVKVRLHTNRPMFQFIYSSAVGVFADARADAGGR
jgi:hypothetical protein